VRRFFVIGIILEISFRRYGQEDLHDSLNDGGGGPKATGESISAAL
jgi:hypothetical protein